MLRGLLPPLFALALASPAAAGDAVVTTDFAERLAPRPSMTGVLHSFSRDAPPDARIAPLRLGLVRGMPTSAPYVRGVEFGARYTVVLSDGWGMPGSTPAWHGNGPPYADLDRWRTYVETAARRARGHDVIWDIWNEPNLGYFWQGTREQYHKTFRVAERALRRLHGRHAFVIGPSTSGYHPAWAASLTAYCRRHGCRVDGLSWHELPGPGGGVPPVDAHVREMRARFADRGDGRAVGVSELHVNEALPQDDQAYPGEQLATLALLEAGGADASARACWGSGDESSCYDNTLDGLLTPEDPRTPALSYQPRAVWWATRRYADGVGARVRVTTTRSRVQAVASRAAPDERTATVALGYVRRRGTADPGTPVPGRIDVRVRLRGLTRLPFVGRSATVELRIERIPATGTAALARPEAAGTRRVRVRGGEAEVTLRGVRLHEAWVVRVKHAG